MQRITTLALAGVLSAALLSAGCENSNKKNQDQDVNRDTSSTARTSSTSGYGADDKDATTAKDSTSAKDSSSAKDASSEKDASKDKDASTASNAAKSTGASKDKDDQATTAAQSDSNRGNRGQGRGGRAAHATIAPSKAPGQDDVKGTVVFTAAEKGVKVRAEITGLEPNSKHGFHIHEKGDLSDPELKSAGGHFNPGMHKHGGPDTGEHHAGDLGNLEADDKGKATYDATVEGITLDDAKTGIIGKSVVVHGKADDLKTDPAGDSGPRIAAGVIERGRGGEGGQRRGQQRGEQPRNQQGGQQ